MRLYPLPDWETPTEEQYKKAEDLGVCKELVHTRIGRYGWTVEKATSYPYYNRPPKKIQELMKKNNISRNTFRSRKAKGMTDIEAATKPNRKCPRKPDEYLKWEEIAVKNGIKKSTYAQRIKRKWSYEDAATKELISREERAKMAGGKKAKNPDYYKYKGIALNNGINILTYKDRIRRGWSYEKAGTTLTQKHNNINCKSK